MSSRDFDDANLEEDGFDDLVVPKKGKKSDGLLEDGVCDGCGNIGLVGDTCPICGGTFQDLNVGLEDTLDDEEPDTYPLEMLDEEDDGRGGKKGGSFDDEGETY